MITPITHSTVLAIGDILEARENAMGRLTISKHYKIKYVNHYAIIINDDDGHLCNYYRHCMGILFYKVDLDYEELLEEELSDDRTIVYI